jgi:hypothetical protein
VRSCITTPALLNRTSKVLFQETGGDGANVALGVHVADVEFAVLLAAGALDL